MCDGCGNPIEGEPKITIKLAWIRDFNASDKKAKTKISQTFGAYNSEKGPQDYLHFCECGCLTLFFEDKCTELGHGAWSD